MVKDGFAGDDEQCLLALLDIRDTLESWLVWDKRMHTLVTRHNPNVIF
ncbi:hypothetical protein M8C21_025475 [Ambrosia artemisiifolia]|uniref:Uncharacterized protein n=1 Tax=Ambrosia artemisiifolia TaxID=4212 RepID=A0AAD5GAM3_AMBAR|nr:hypothetical protein M8C21_025475 [Ambrosia artemisiifolia]